MSAASLMLPAADQFTRVPIGLVYSFLAISGAAAYDPLRGASMTLGSKRTASALLITISALLATAQLSAQSPSQVQPDAVRIGIPLMRNSSTRPISPRLQRDSLVRAFQPEKKKKGKQLELPRIEAIALESDSLTEATREAREKNCDYVLYTNLVELREPGDPQPHNKPGSVSIGRDPLAAYPDPSVMHDPVHYAVVEYRLRRLDNSQARLALSVSGQEHADENGTVQQLLFLIVRSVKGELRQSSDAAK